MKELVNYKDVWKNQREVWGSSRLTTKLNLVLKILLIRPTKDAADPHWFVIVVVPSQVFFYTTKRNHDLIVKFIYLE